MNFRGFKFKGIGRCLGLEFGILDIVVKTGVSVGEVSGVGRCGEGYVIF